MEEKRSLGFNVLTSKKREEFNVPIIPVIGITILEHLDENLNAIKNKIVLR